MGIHGLSSFIINNSTLGVDYSWHLNNKETNNDCLIFDGNAFVFHYAFIFRKNWTHGGQYNDFAKTINCLVTKLQTFGFNLTFLFDGALPEAKEETRVRRYKGYIESVSTIMSNLSHINNSNKQQQNSAVINDGPQYRNDLYIIPPLTIEVCIQTLRELGVTVLVSSGEADGLVVKLAQEKNGYVVSKDSDMYIYPHCGKGYIPLDTLKIPTINDSYHTDIITATIYQPERLAHFLQLDISLLPLFGTLLGNDYIDIKYIKHPIMDWCSTTSGFQVKKQGSSQWPRYVSEFLRYVNQFIMNSQQDTSIIDRVVSQLKPVILNSGVNKSDEFAANLGNIIVESIYRYDPQSALLKQAIHSSSLSLSSLHNDVILANIQGSRQILDIITTHTFWTGIYIEDVHLESSWNISESLRQVMYGLLNVDMVKERLREKGHLTVKEVISINVNEENSSLATKKKLLMKLHHAPSNIQNFENKVPPSLQPLILCLRYFIQSSFNINLPLANHEVVAILVASMVNILPEILPNEFNINDAPTALIDTSEKDQNFIAIPSLKIRSIHLLSQWQHIILSSHYLAQVLLSLTSPNTVSDLHDHQDLNNIHFMQTGVLANIFNGVTLHTCLQLGRLGASMGKMMLGASSKWIQLFGILYSQVIEDGYDNKMEKVFDYKFTKQSMLSDGKSSWMKSRVLKKIDDQPKKSNSPSTSSTNKIVKPKPPLHQHNHKNQNGSSSSSSINAFNVLSFGCQFDE
ncbi:unnamed protein product [Cunninghamella blakesleeana]